MTRATFLTLTVLSITLAGVHAQDTRSGARPAAPKAGGTVVTSDRSTVLYERGVVLFEGNVVVTDPEMTLKAEQMTVAFTAEKQIKTITAQGNVRLFRKEGTASGKKAVFDAVARTVVLTGEPKLQRGTDVLAGETITLFLNEKKMICTPARMVFNPERQDPLFNWFKE